MRANTKRFIEAMGMADTARRQIDIGLDSCDMPQSVKQLVRDALVGDLGHFIEDRLAPLVEVSLSENEVEEIIAFYETPIGRKSLAAAASIQVQAAEAGRQWGADVATRLEPELNRLIAAESAQ